MELFRYYVNEWYRNRLNLKDLFYCQIHITKRCQNKCKHCYFRELASPELDISLDRLLMFLTTIKDRANALGLCARVDFTGGDPLLYPQLEAVTEHCRLLGIQYGFKCNPESIVRANNAIKRQLANSMGVSLSLDGLREVHDSYRRKGSFDCTIEAISILKQLGVQLRINTTVSRENINNLIPLIDFLVQEHIVVDDYTWARYWSLSDPEKILNAVELKCVFEEMTCYLATLFSRPDFYYRTIDNRVIPRIMFGFKEHQWYPFFAKSGYICKEIQEAVTQSSNCFNCTATKHFYIVDPDLSIYKCRKLPETKISLEEFGTVSACQYSRTHKIQCADCKYYNGCGGCSAIAKSFTGSIHEVEPFCPYFTS